MQLDRRIRNTTVALLIAFAFTSSTLAQTTRYSPDGDQLPGPDCLAPVRPNLGPAKICTTDDYRAWLDDISHWRAEMKVRSGFSDENYNRPGWKWTQSSFIQPQMMVEDRYFYDPVAGKYTVDRYLEDVERRYGGIDSVLIWPVYPNIGIDDRNQFDMLRAMPGGISGVKQMVEDFHRHGVHVFFPVMAWDQGTRDEGASLWNALTKLLAEVGADGINGDTLRGLPLAFQTAADAMGHPIVLEPEHAMPFPYEALSWNTMTWGYWQYPDAPMVSAFKWIEPRHMVNVCDRWKHDKTDNLQFAFFNGVGYESWENVWGIWNGITPRDAEALRRVAAVERAVADFLVSPDWQPYAATEQYGIYASRWPLGHDTVWTIVNRTQTDAAGRQLRVITQPGMRYFDLWHGNELTPEADSNSSYLSFPIEAHGFAAVFATPASLSPRMQSLLDGMKRLAAQPLGTYSHEWKFLPQTMIDIPPTPKTSASPAGMVKVPGAEFSFRVNGIETEGFNDIGVDVQYPWEDSPRRHHLHGIQVHAFWIDKYPVTNAQFKAFLDATHYHPSDDGNFLKDWHNGVYPSGWEQKPVTWISLEDARAYAVWAGKRLPHEWEWQYAAQGNTDQIYPWGDSWNEKAVPRPDKDRSLRGPDNVDAHPLGASIFGVQDFVGNVWQWTDEFVDEHTRSGILRGGSYYQPQGSIWYFPQAYRLDQHGKLLLMGPSKDRSGTVGFRCVEDAE